MTKQQEQTIETLRRSLEDARTRERERAMKEQGFRDGVAFVLREFARSVTGNRWGS